MGFRNRAVAKPAGERGPGAGALPVNWSRYFSIPYRLRGRAEETGIDCWGLARLIYREELGIELPSHGALYAKDLRKVSANITNEAGAGPWSKIETGQERIFDIVLLLSLFRGEAVPLHVGIVTQPAFCIHIEEDCESVHLPFRDAAGVRGHWSLSRRLVGIYRHERLLNDQAPRPQE